MIIVQVNPVKIIGEVSNPGDYNCYDYIQVASVPVGILDKYLKVVDGQVIEMSADEKTAVDNLIINKQWVMIRADRNKLLSTCDWAQLVDSPQVNDQNWKTYRQSLRDITTQTDPYSITWPTEPA
jgi:hypothetical protein